MAGWGSFLGGLMEKLPIQGRVERWKNKLENLEKKRKELLKSEWTPEKGKMLDRIDRDIDKLNQLLKNKAN